MFGSRSCVFAFCALVLVGMSGCSEPARSPVVSIQSVDPSGDVPLVGGDQVTFTVMVRAHGIEEPSWVGLMVQSEGVLLGAVQPVPVVAGAAERLQVKVTVPASSSVQVIAPLYVGSAQQTSVVDVRHFKVAGRRE